MGFEHQFIGLAIDKKYAPCSCLHHCEDLLQDGIQELVQIQGLAYRRADTEERLHLPGVRLGFGLGDFTLGNVHKRADDCMITSIFDGCDSLRNPNCLQVFSNSSKLIRQGAVAFKGFYGLSSGQIPVIRVNIFGCICTYQFTVRISRYLLEQSVHVNKTAILQKIYTGTCSLKHAP